MRRGAIATGVAAVLMLVALAACDSSADTANDSRSQGSPESVTVVAQNLLHGLACPADSDRCLLPKRVQLFARQLEEAGCPEVVSIEESDPVMDGFLRIVMLNPNAIPKFCGGRYRLVGSGDPGSDREVILTTLPVLAQERTRLAGPLRDALWVRLRARLGPLDVVATHLASESDDRPCDSTTCAPPCRPDDMLKTCQGREAAALLASHHTPESVGVLVGDLNAQPGDATIEALEGRGLVDTFLAAKNAECDAATGVGCTGGREDANLTDLTNPSSRQAARIDYVFLSTTRPCHVTKPTGLFAALPSTPPIDGLVFASDHTGVQAKIVCATTARDRAEARPVAGSSSTTTTRAAAVDPATTAAVTKTFEAVFNGDAAAPLATRAESLQDSPGLRDAFLARAQDPATKVVADRVRVRIDSMEQLSHNDVKVAYSIVLDQAVVLDHLPGAAVRVGDRWLVSRQTYCQVATLGETSVPEPCR